MERVERELASMSSFDGTEYHSSPQSMLIEVAMFSAWATLAEESSQHSLSSEQKATVSRLRRRISQIQVAEFPKMRRAWAAQAGRGLWEHDIEVQVTGNGGKTLRLTGGVFAANRNVREAHAALEDLPRLLRFKRVEYRWYEGADRYQYYTITSEPDSKILPI